jgi:hypothetical protein
MLELSRHVRLHTQHQTIIQQHTQRLAGWQARSPNAAQCVACCSLALCNCKSRPIERERARAWHVRRHRTTPPEATSRTYFSFWRRQSIGNPNYSSNTVKCLHPREVQLPSSLSPSLICLPLRTPLRLAPLRRQEAVSANKTVLAMAMVKEGKAAEEDSTQGPARTAAGEVGLLGMTREQRQATAVHRDHSQETWLGRTKAPSKRTETKMRAMTTTQSSTSLPK